MSLSSFRPLFQPVFLEVLQEKTQACAALVPDAFVEELVRYPVQMAGGDGKRVRPYLVWLMAGGQSDRALMRFTTALELFHTFALIHDDVIDHGALRHGAPTTHVHATAQMTASSRVGDLVHVGNAQGILVGDLLFQWAREVFDAGAAFIPADQFAAARDAFNHMVNEVIVGQMIDVDIATRTEVPMALIQTKMQLKTASYTLVRPLQIGMALAGMDVNAPWVHRFGQSLGVAFQIQDDLLDLTSREVEIGKAVFSDLRAHQPTVFTQHIVEHGTDAERTALASLMGTALTEADRERVTKLFTDSGAIAAGVSQATQLFNEAAEAVADAPEAVRPALQELIQVIRTRRS